MKNNYYFLYFFFDNQLIRWIRVGVFLAIGIFVYLNLHDSRIITRLLPFYFILILQECFIHFKLELGKPKKKVSDDVSHPIESVDFKLRAMLERHPTVEKAMKEIKNNREVQYFNRLLAITYPKHEFAASEEDLLKKAYEISQRAGGVYVHPIDLYAAYLLMLDDSTKFLFNQELDEKDIITVLSWTRKQFLIDVSRKRHISFTGSGVFDFFVFGWSAQLQKYAVNYTDEVLDSESAVPIGRDKEYDLLITALSKSSASNALIVGPAGVGKSTLVSQFVVDSNQGNLPGGLSNKIVFKLQADHLFAGVTNEGDLQERFVELFSELSHAGNIVVYIPNIENIFGGGGSNIDISAALSEYLKSSRIKIIGSTTPEALQRYIYSKQEIKELFDNIEIQEPDEDTALIMVLEKAKQLSHENNIVISYGGIKEACKLSGSYVNDGSAMPGRAVRLLEDAIANASTHGIKVVTQKEIISFIEEKTHIAIAQPDAQESQQLLDLETEMHKRIISQDSAVHAVAEAMRRVRSGLKEENKPIASFLFLGPTGVGKTETAKALAASYFGDEKSMIRLDMSEYQNSDSQDRLLGKEGEYTDTITDKILKTPFSLVLLDEFEKAAPQILDLFLQVLDEGRLTDNRGRTVSFNNAIIIATSNAGSELIREMSVTDSFESKKEMLVSKILEMKIFKPELINRFDEVVVFKQLSEDEVVSISKLFLEEVVDRAKEKQLLLTYDESVPAFIAKRAYSAEFGARNIRRFIEQSVESQLSKLILSQALHHGESAKIKIDNDSLVITL